MTACCLPRHPPNSEQSDFRSPAVLLACLAILALLLAYLVHSARKLDTFLPGEKPLVELVGRFLFQSKRGYDGSLASVGRQDVLIAQVMIFFVPATLIFLAAVRAALTCRLPTRKVMGIVLVGSALLRLELVPSPPVLETDFHRYLWDGAVTWSGLNPFQFAPVEVGNHALGQHRELYRPEELVRLDRLAHLSSAPALSRHFARINHPTVPTIYPPGAQAFFALVHALAPGDTMVLKGLVALADLAAVGVLTMLLARLGRDPRWAIGYGWCPLVLKEYAGTGHFDPLAILFTLFALFWAMQGKALRAALALAAASLVKLFPVLLVPVLFRHLRLRGMALFTLAILFGYAPFLGLGPAVFDGLFAFGSNWQFNSSLFAGVDAVCGKLLDNEHPFTLSLMLGRKSSFDPVLVSEHVLDSYFAAKLVTGLCLAGLVLALTPRRDLDDLELTARAGIVVAGLLLLSPVADPWYLGWVAPFACIFPSAAAAWLAWAMSLCYVYYLDWKYVWFHRSLEYVPFWPLLALDCRRWRRAPTSSPEALRHVTP